MANCVHCGKFFKQAAKCLQTHMISCKENPNACTTTTSKTKSHKTHANDLNQAFALDDDDNLVFEEQQLSYWLDFTNELGIQHANKLVFMLLNINSFENKMTSVSSLSNDKNIDILVIQETKINPILVDSYFGLDGYNLIRRDRVENQG
jgi:hypothetical protein